MSNRVCGDISRCSELNHAIPNEFIPERSRFHACLPTSPLLAQRARSTVEAEGRRGGTTLTARASHTMAGTRHARWLLHSRMARLSGPDASRMCPLGLVSRGVDCARCDLTASGQFRSSASFA